MRAYYTFHWKASPRRRFHEITPTPPCDWKSILNYIQTTYLRRRRDHIIAYRDGDHTEALLPNDIIHPCEHLVLVRRPRLEDDTITHTTSSTTPTLSAADVKLTFGVPKTHLQQVSLEEGQSSVGVMQDRYGYFYKRRAMDRSVDVTSLPPANEEEEDERDG